MAFAAALDGSVYHATGSPDPDVTRENPRSVHIGATWSESPQGGDICDSVEVPLPYDSDIRDPGRFEATVRPDRQSMESTIGT